MNIPYLKLENQNLGIIFIKTILFCRIRNTLPIVNYFCYNQHIVLLNSQGMKRYHSILFLTLFAIITVSVNAQNKIGIRAGYQSSAFYKDGSQLSGTDNYSSFYLGLYKENKIIPILHFGLGLEYMQTGAVWKSTNDKQVLNYLSIPLYLKAKLGPVFALGGVAANIKVGEHYSGTTSPLGNQSFKGIDFPLFLGAGFKLLMFTIEARYNWGMIDINDGVSNQYLQLGAGISF
jgi:hypothetical protein